MKRSLVVVLAIAGLGVAGCGGSGKSNAKSTPTAKETGAARAVKYSQCMRANGVPAFPDPVNGRTQLTVTKGGALDPESPQFKGAQEKCKSLAPEGEVTGPQNAKQQAQALKFVACMRKSGVPNFPDMPDGKLLFKSGSGVDPNSPAFKNAMQTCRKLLPGGGPSQ